ncbi:hypothetical protein BDV98DRAFT_596539 [Pterulicium gracile]|uniref:Uncharacterized protein n=1 Tax=Pterulicium gracile TaxID=1884261 RepID=A0A5C3QH00_9AGAR|nr:hypothetical protein BDV98DRAFT_596539 [Pterula gracilis]
MPMRLCDAEVYARSLLPRLHGYPLWVPEPFGRIGKFRQVGVRVGDVGYVTDIGSFKTLFNVLVARDDPNISQLKESQGVGTVISGIDTHDSTDVETDLFANDNLIGLQASSGASDQLRNTWGTAVLHLPHGATRLSAPRGSFVKYAIENAPSWYDFVNGELGRYVPNGNVYLITSCNKSSSWTLAKMPIVSSGQRVTRSSEDGEMDPCAMF